MTTASTASRAGLRRLLAIVSALALALAFSLQTLPASAAMTEEQLYAQQKSCRKRPTSSRSSWPIPKGIWPTARPA